MIYIVGVRKNAEWREPLGQKCSALSRVYVSSSIWEAGFQDQLLAEIAKIRVGPPQDFRNFMGPVM